jgi:hypothetical protein
MSTTPLKAAPCFASTFHGEAEGVHAFRHFKAAAHFGKIVIRAA